MHIIENSVCQRSFPVVMDTLGAASAFRALLKSDPESNDCVDGKFGAHNLNIFKVGWF